MLTRDGEAADSREPRFGSPFAASMLVTHKVAAAILGVDAKTLTRLWRSGQIAGSRRPSGEVRFSEADLQAYLTGRPSSSDRRKA